MKFDVKNIISKLQDFAAFHPEIIAIYLFGSLLTRKNAEDIDTKPLRDIKAYYLKKAYGPHD